MALGKLDVWPLLERRPRRPHRPTVGFDSEASPTATLIQVVVFCVTLAGRKLAAAEEAALRAGILAVCGPAASAPPRADFRAFIMS